MKKLWCLTLSLILLVGCGGGQGRSAEIYAMDTTMELTAYGPNAQEALDAAVETLNRLDALWSAARPDSDIARANAAQGQPVTIASETTEILEKALALCADTRGALDVTIYPVMEAWGFPTKEYRVPTETELAAALERIDYSAITVKDNSLMVPVGMKLDLGSVGKGGAADETVALWRDMGITSGLLYLGGNIQCLGAKPDGSDWTVGIRDPEDERAVLAVVSGRDMAVVTSGGYQRNFEQAGKTYHHIMDPETARPADSGAASVTVIAPSGLMCDGLSTALFVMGLDGAEDYWRQHRDDFDMVYYTQDGELWYTAGLKDRLTLRDGLEGQMLT